MAVSMESPFGLLCGGTGGLSIISERQNMGARIRSILAMLRERYILEFQRPSNGTAGLHEIVVSVADKTALVRVCGVTTPLQDKATLHDPSTVPSDASRAPVMGDRRILTSPQ